MAMVKCRNCGKEITDIYDNCPYCKTPVQSLNNVDKTNDVTNDDLTENLILTGYGSFLALLALILFNSLSNITSGRFVGDMALAAGATAWGAFFIISVAVMFLGAILHTFLPLLIKRFSGIPDQIITLIVTFILTVISTAVLLIFKMPILGIYQSSPELIHMASQYALYYGIAVPVIQGAMILSGKNHSPLIGVAFELLPLAVFLILGVLLLPLLTLTLALGIGGIVWGGIIAAILTLAAAAVKSFFITGF